jgi:hypothetical protein
MVGCLLRYLSKTSCNGDGPAIEILELCYKLVKPLSSPLKN